MKMTSLKEKKIIVSAVNFSEGGPLTILNNCLLNLSEFSKKFSEYNVIAFVYDKSLCYYPNIKYIEIKDAKKSWLKRLYIEYFYFYNYSKKINPFLWLSLHDITPRVISKRRVTYFHNPSPFRKLNFKDAYFNFKEFLFSIFYKFIYMVNSSKNDFIIVQQDWLRENFSKMLNIPRSKIIIAYPKEKKEISVIVDNNSKNKFQFFYPSFPRSFKNFEIICEAAALLEKKGLNNFSIILTINGEENKYTKYLKNKYNKLSTLSLIGLISRKEVESLYATTDCLLFPSFLETWGLPLSEFSNYDKPILAADLPYAYEAASGSKFINFFDPNSSQELATKMELLVNGDFSFLGECHQKKIDDPFFQSWKDLFDFIIK